MKKKWINGYRIPIHLVKKTVVVMKLTLLLTVVFSLSSWATSVAQENKVSLQMEDASLEEIILVLRAQTGVRFFYSIDKIKSFDHLSVRAKDESLRDVLNRLLAGTGLTYTLLDDVVVIKEVSKLLAADSLHSFVVKGFVYNEQKQPLPGVTVRVVGTSLGTASSINGWFSITLPIDKGRLEFSFIGYESQQVSFHSRSDTLRIVLKEKIQDIEEVVVTGYQTIQKRAMAGSTSSVKAEDLLLNGVQTLEQALQGQIPGMIVMNRSGLTGTRQRIRVRGTSTLLGNAEPVWVVDGVIQEDPLPFSTNDFNNLDPSNMDMIRDFVGGAISWLNPSDIESVTVLKDASATAIYGVRAANGVIVITTKKGEMGRMALSYSGNFSLTPRLTYKDLELMNSQQRVEVSREAFNKGYVLKNEPKIGYLGLAMRFKRHEISLEEFTREAHKLEATNTDWFDILFRTAFSNSHTIGISGGKDYTSYRASFGFMDVKNTAKGNDRTQYTANLAMNTTLWKKLTIDMNLAGSIAKTKAYAGNDPYTYASTTNRAIGCYDENHELLFYEDGNNGYLFNIVKELQESGNENTQTSLNANFSFRWRILEALTFNTLVSCTHSNTIGESWRSEETNYIANLRKYNYGEYVSGDKEFEDSNIPVGGELNESVHTNTSWTWRNQLEYLTLINNVHSFSVVLGHEMRSTKATGYEKTTYGYMPDRGKIFVQLPTRPASNPNLSNNLLSNVPTITDTENNYLSFYLTFNYMYDNRYAINASVRSDASNRFGQDKSTRFLPVWAVGLRWNAGYESWFQGQKILSDMTWRLSYGYQGNVVESVSPDLIATIVANGRDYALEVNDLPAPELKWEKVHNLNVGIDLGLFENRVTATFEYYMKKTKDMVIDQQIPFENGVSSRPINSGDMSNSGWDANVNFIPVRTKDWIVTCGFNFSKVYNEIKSELEPSGTWEEASSGNLNKEGYPVSSFWAFRFTGLNPENGGPQFDLSGAELQESERDATLYMTHAGKMEPDFTTNLNLSIRYKTWTLSTGLYFSFGNQQFMAPMSTNYTSIPEEYENMSTEWLKRWRNPGDEEHTNIPSLPDIRTSAKTIRIESSVQNGLTAGERTFMPYGLYAYSDIRVVDAWFIRCNNLLLSYTIPTDKLPDFMQNASFNFSVTNPFQIRSKDFLGRDPEVVLGNQPLSRVFSLGINVSF